MATENRQQDRLAFEGKMFIERVSSDVQSGSPADVLVCMTADISASGVRAGVKRELPVGATLQVGVELAGEGHTLHLVGEVRWCIPSADEDDFWLVGFQLLDAQDSDIDEWQAYIISKA